MKRRFITFMIVALAVLVAAPGLFATQYTKTALWDRTNANWGPFVYFQHTFIAATDTFYCPFTMEYGNSNNPAVTIGILTTKLATDSVCDISVRYQVSVDNANWQTFTLGTDSTTWATALAYGSYTPVFMPITATNGGNTSVGFFPYTRIKVFGNVGNSVAGTRVRVYILNQKGR
jgi:hypothetical protein